MSGDEDLDEPAEDAAEAFLALRAEVAALREAIEDLPDTAPTLAVIAKSLASIEQHPALRLTPQAHAGQIRSVQESARRESERVLDQAAQRVNAAAGELARIVEQARTAERQNRRLLQVGGAAAIGGAVLWAALSGPIARRLPESWAIPEKMAAATMGEDRATAGQRMIETVNPQEWAESVEAIKLLRANREALAACRQRAVEGRRASRCSINVAPAS